MTTDSKTQARNTKIADRLERQFKFLGYSAVLGAIVLLINYLIDFKGIGVFFGALIWGYFIINLIYGILLLSKWIKKNKST